VGHRRQPIGHVACESRKARVFLEVARQVDCQEIECCRGSIRVESRQILGEHRVLAREESTDQPVEITARAGQPKLPGQLLAFGVLVQPDRAQVDSQAAQKGMPRKFT